MKNLAWYSKAMGFGPLWIRRDLIIQKQTIPSDEAIPPETLSPLVGTVSLQPGSAPPLAPVESAETALLTPSTVTLPNPSDLPIWATLKQEVINCTRCQLCQTRLNTVFGRGKPGARWLLVGEAPGANEDKEGLAFVGRAGQLLDNMLHAIGLDGNTDAFITNVLKCRPPGNRNPAGDEIIACQHFLHAQIAHLQPELILALGRFAAQTLLNTDKSISRLREQVHHYHGIPLIVTFHPAYLLRNLPDKQKAWEDLIFASKTLNIKLDTT